MDKELYQNLRKGLWRSFNIFSRDCVSEVIWTDQDGGQPKGTYLTLNIDINEDEENPEFHPNADGNIRSVFRNTITMKLQTYGIDAASAMSTIRRRLQMASWKQLAEIELIDLGVCAGLYDVLPIINVSELVDTSVQERRSMDVLYRFTEEIIDDGECGEGMAITKINIRSDLKIGDQTIVTKESEIIKDS